MITLATRAAMAANAQVVAVLRLIGARDSYIASAFVRRFTLRAFFGAAIGTAAGALAMYLLPSKNDQAMILSGLGFQKLQWLWLLALPPIIAAVAFFATRQATRRELRRLR
ncbi:MAG: FtsX-like permease family protein, partial [Paracoccaceae bacterium]